MCVCFSLLIFVVAVVVVYLLAASQRARCSHYHPLCCTENADNEQFNSEPRLAREKINVINKITNIYLFFSATVYGYI